MKSIFEIELHSSKIYKPPCSPSAAPCGPWESCCSLVASIASFIFVLYLNSGQVRKDSSRIQVHRAAVLSQKTSGSFGAAKNATNSEFFEVCR